MRILLQLLVFVSSPIILKAQQTLNGSIMHDGIQRDYILYVPETYAPGTPAPLVLNFHGYTSNAMEQMFYGDFRPIADTAGFLIVHPLGTTDLIGNPHWNVGWGTSATDDLGFTAALIDSLSDAYDINQERIYSTGMSNGGFMSYFLACELSDRIAAIASVTGSMNNSQLTTCQPGRPVPVMEIHGTADETVAYEGNFLFAATEEVIDFWATYNACDTPPVITAVDNADTTDSSTAEHHVYGNGDNGVAVEHFKIIDGAHTWPGSTFILGVTNNDINASKEIWRFFSAYDIHGLIVPTSALRIPDMESLRVYPNPAKDHVTVVFSSEEDTLYILSSLLGQVVLSGIIQNGSMQLDLSSLTAGMYVLRVGKKVIKIGVAN